MSGVPLSAVEPQNTIRENKVQRLIEKFKNHKHMGLQDHREQDARTFYDQPSGSKKYVGNQEQRCVWIAQFLVYVSLQLNRKMLEDIAE